MTKHENSQFERFLGSWDEFRKNNEERHQFLVNSIENLHTKIDSGHSQQQQEIEEIKVDIHDADMGLKSVVNKHQAYLRNAKVGIRWLLGVIGLEIIALIGYFREKLLNLMP